MDAEALEKAQDVSGRHPAITLEGRRRANFKAVEDDANNAAPPTRAAEPAQIKLFPYDSETADEPAA